MARHAFWTIIIGDQPTAFRAPVKEELLPTLKQLQRQTPDATIKWFQRGQLWDTPGDAMDAVRPPRRGPGWRPGGEHKDPRDAYKVPRDVKRKRWAAQAAEGRGPWVRDAARAGRPPRADRPDRAPGDRPFRPRPDGDRSGPPRRDRDGADRPPFPRAKTGRGFDDRGPRPGGHRPRRDDSRGSYGGSRDARDTRPGRDRDRPRAGGGFRPDGDRGPSRPRPPFDRDRSEGTRRAPDRDRPRDDRRGKRSGEWTPSSDRKPSGDWRPAGDRKRSPSGAPGPKPAGRPRAEGKRDWREPRPDRDAIARPAGSKTGGRPAKKPFGSGRPAGGGSRGPVRKRTKE